ncbi:MAG TPA: hypothetical protein VM536_16375, partial [Chloroflexia bacterium]|nr:hypothetical protein [Chloroflexia bacterium]
MSDDPNRPADEAEAPRATPLEGLAQSVARRVQRSQGALSPWTQRALGVQRRLQPLTTQAPAAPPTASRPVATPAAPATPAATPPAPATSAITPAAPAPAAPRPTESRVALASASNQS